MSGKNPKGAESPIARRLRLLRAAEGAENAYAFAARLGIEYKTYNNYENGYPIPMQAAGRLLQKIPGFSIDWLVAGREEALSFDLRRRLEAAALAEAQQRGVGRGGRAKARR